MKLTTKRRKGPTDTHNKVGLRSSFARLGGTYIMYLFTYLHKQMIC